MRIQNQILSNLNRINEDAKDDWYYLCNDAEQALFKVKNECHDERAINALERMILELNNIRMEQYSALNEYALNESWEQRMDLPEGYDPEVYDAYFSDIATLDLVDDEQPDFVSWLEDKQNELVNHVKSVYKDNFHIVGSDGTEYKTDEELKSLMYSIILDYGSYLKFNNIEAKDWSLIDHFDGMNGEYSMWEVIADDQMNESESIEVENGELKGQSKIDMEDFARESVNSNEVVKNINAFSKIVKAGGYKFKNDEEVEELFNYYLDLCKELQGNLKESDFPEIDEDPDLDPEQVEADVSYWTEDDLANTEDVSGRDPIGVYSVSNSHSILVYDYDGQDGVLVGDSTDTTKARWRGIIYEPIDELTTDVYFWYGDLKVPMNEVIRTNLTESITAEVDMAVDGAEWYEIENNIGNLIRQHGMSDKVDFKVKKYSGQGGWPLVQLTGEEKDVKELLTKLGYEDEGSYSLVESVELPSFQEVVNKELTVKDYDIEETGGSVYVAWGAFEEYPLFFAASSDGIAVYDADERIAMQDEEYDGYTWENQHSISGASYHMASVDSPLYKSVITQIYNDYTNKHPNTAYINNMDLFCWNTEFLTLKEEVEIDPLKELAKKYFEYTTTISITEDEWFSYLDQAFPEFKNMDREQAVEYATNLLLDDLKNNHDAIKQQIETDLGAYSADSLEHKDITAFIDLLKQHGINIDINEGYLKESSFDVDVEYLAASDSDPQNENEYFDTAEEAIEHAKKLKLDRVYKIDHIENTADEIWCLDDLLDDGPTSDEDGAYFRNDKQNDVWITGWYVKDGKRYYVNAKVFLEPSEYGINNGPVSKLSISDEADHLIVNYDRSWDVRPSQEYKEVYREILKAVKKFRKENPYDAY